MSKLVKRFFFILFISTETNLIIFLRTTVWIYSSEKSSFRLDCCSKKSIVL